MKFYDFEDIATWRYFNHGEEILAQKYVHRALGHALKVYLSEIWANLFSLRI